MFYQQKVINGILHCRYSPQDKWIPVYKTKNIKPILKFSKDRKTKIDFIKLQNYLKFNSNCEEEIYKMNLEAGEAMTKRLIINVN